jgi:hypothetical protein
MTIPVIAPPERDEDEEWFTTEGADEGEELEVVLDAAEAMDPALEGVDDDCAEDAEDGGAVVDLECVSVCASNDDAVKASEVAEGEAELRDEYTLSRSAALMLRSVDGCLFQQM